MVFELKSIRKNIWTIIIHHISKKISSIFSIHTSRKIAYTKMYKDSKINQSIFKSSWVHNLAKCMHVICENNERYDCKIARWIQKIMQCMWILKINDAWKKFGQKLRNWKFFSFDRSSIDQKPIKLGREQWLKIKGFSICRKTHSINQNSGKLDFLKNCRSLYKKHST